MRPRDGSKDYFDRMRAGDIPEDPWGHTNYEAKEPWILFRKYRFFEKPLNGPLRPTYAIEMKWHASLFGDPPSDAKYVRFFGYDGVNRSTLRREFVRAPLSQYGYTWRENTNPLTDLLNIYPGEMTVVHLSTGNV